MTLLEATSHLIDLAKSCGPGDKITIRAIKRMEQRLDVLRLRAAKSLRARRHKAWPFYGEKDLKCPSCGTELTFGDFCKGAQLDGRAFIKRWDCPACGIFLLGYEKPKDAKYDLIIQSGKAEPSPEARP